MSCDELLEHLHDESRIVVLAESEAAGAVIKLWSYDIARILGKQVVRQICNGALVGLELRSVVVSALA